MAEVNIDCKCFKQSVALFHSFPDGEFKISLFGLYLFDWRPPEPIRGSRVDCSSSWAPSSSTSLKILPIAVLQYYLVCQKKILYVPVSKKNKNNTTTSYCIWSRFAVCKPACFSDCPDPQSSVQQQIHHIDWAAEGAQTDECSLKLRSKLHIFLLTCSGIPNYMHHACNSTYFLRGCSTYCKWKEKLYSFKRSLFFSRLQ